MRGDSVLVDRIEIPRDITPTDFFLKFLPEQFEKTKNKLSEEAKRIYFIMSFEITGEGGGKWTLKIDRGNFFLYEGEDNEANLRIIQTIEDWNASMTGDKGLKWDLPLIEGKGFSLSQQKIDKLKAVNGSITFKVENAQKGDWEIKIKLGKFFNSGNECEIVLSHEDLKTIKRGQLNPQVAFLTGKIRIKGSMALIMKVASCFM